MRIAKHCCLLLCLLISPSSGALAQNDSDDPVSILDVDLREPSAICRDRGTVVLVIAKRHVMALCEKDEARAMFRVSLGTNGTGKTKQGDSKTPLGRYPLSRPRTSTSFSQFIQVGYPTPSQVAQGFTGSGVGIHGPSRMAVTWSPLERVSDWTEGCIAVWSDGEIHEVADWVAKKGRVDVVIE